MEADERDAAVAAANDDYIATMREPKAAAKAARLAGDEAGIERAQAALLAADERATETRRLAIFDAWEAFHETHPEAIQV